MYNCLLVGFIWVRVSRIWLFWNLFPLYRVISKNVSSVSLISCVNLMVVCIRFSLVMYASKSGFEPVQVTKMSSINLFHIRMCGLPNSFNFISSLPMNRFAYAGAIFVPIAVP